MVLHHTAVCFQVGEPWFVVQDELLSCDRICTFQWFGELQLVHWQSSTSSVSWWGHGWLHCVLRLHGNDGRLCPWPDPFWAISQDASPHIPMMPFPDVLLLSRFHLLRLERASWGNCLFWFSESCSLVWLRGMRFLLGTPESEWTSVWLPLPVVLPSVSRFVQH